MFYGSFSLMFTVVWALVIVILITNLVKSFKQWNKDNHSPRLTVAAKVVAKRTHTSHHRHDNHTHRTTHYYVTFEVESGDRMELNMAGHEYGLLVEGDRGKLTFQGSRYLGFERT